MGDGLLEWEISTHRLVRLTSRRGGLILSHKTIPPDGPLHINCIVGLGVRRFVGGIDHLIAVLAHSCEWGE